MGSQKVQWATDTRFVIKGLFTVFLVGSIAVSASPSDRFKQAQQAAMEGRSREARSIVEDVIGEARDPETTANARYFLATIEIDEGNRAEAIVLLEQNLRESPAPSTGRSSSAQALMKMYTDSGRLKEAQLLAEDWVPRARDTKTRAMW